MMSQNTTHTRNQNSSELSHHNISNNMFQNKKQDKSPNGLSNKNQKNQNKPKKKRNEIDYEDLIAQKKTQIETQKPAPHTTSANSKIFVCVRKRPIFDKEIENGEIDCVSAINPKLCVYDCKMKIDGYTKYIDTNEFYFDNVFRENESTRSLYECSIKSTFDMLYKGGVVTCFAYGQTGSGKTFTMKGIQDEAIDSLFETFSKQPGRFCFYVSFYEIYSGRLYDLLNNRNKVMALEDKNQKVQIFGLEEKKVTSPKEMRDVVEYANTMRTTHNTVTNETSSRSHAICNFVVREISREDDEYAKLTLVDLAGSERATETQSNNKSRLAEGAEINKSLLALKECIRALDARKASGNTEQHVPFRASKLTLVLRDSFISKNNMSKIIMISCVSPGYSSANHTINTLRYADRLKEKTSMMNRNKASNKENINNVNLMLQKNKVNTQLNKNKTKSQMHFSTKNQAQRSKHVFTKKSPCVSTTISHDFSKLVEDNIENYNMNPIPINRPLQTNTSSRGNKHNNCGNYDYLDSNNLGKKHASSKNNNTDYINENNDNCNDNLPNEEQDKLILFHMNLIKDEAKTLTEEGNLISNIKGLTNDNFPMEEYAFQINNIIDKKLSQYAELKKKINQYKKTLNK